MAYNPLNLGDGISREPLASALKKIDTMLSELYVTIPEGDFSAVSQNIVPDGDLAYNLGSPLNRWHSLYVGSGSIYVGDAVISATTNGQIILPGVYDATDYQAIEIYPEGGLEQNRTWGAPEQVKLIDAFSWAALGGQPGIPVPPSWVRATYSATIDAEGYISGGVVVTGGNEYSDTIVNGVNNVATICTDYMYVYIGLDVDPFASFVPADWEQVPFAVRCQSTDVNLSTTIGQNVSYNDLADLPNQNLNTTDSVEFADVTTPSITNNSNSWLFGTNGNLTFPIGLIIEDFSGSPMIRAANGLAAILGGAPALAGDGIIIQAGNAGADDGVDPMTGANGGGVVIAGGAGTGQSTGGTVTIFGGAGANGDFADVTIGNGAGQFHFYGNGTLEFPSGGSIDFDGATMSASQLIRNIDEDFDIKSAGTDGSVVLNWGLTHTSYSNKVTVNSSGVKLTTSLNKDFTFSTDGSVTLPNNSVINVGSAANGSASVGWKEFSAGPTIGWGLYAENDIYIQTFNDITKPTWIFKENGTTQFPGFTFPATDGTNGQVLATNGSGVLAWTTITGGGGGTDISTASINDLADVTVSSPSPGQVLKWNGSAWINDTDATGGGGGGGTLSTRTTRSVTTASIANGASANATIIGFSGYALLSIQTSAAAWVTVYTTTAARTADASRAITDDPVPGSGVIAEVITTGAQTQSFTPGVFGYNDESSPTTDIQIKVVNRSGSTAAITVTVKLLQLEA